MQKLIGWITAVVLVLLFGPAGSAASLELNSGRSRLVVTPDRGGALAGLWYDLNGDGRFSDDELILDSGPDQGLILEVLEIPPGLDGGGRYPTSQAAAALAGKVPGPMESWYGGQPNRMIAVTDSIWREGEDRIVVLGRFFWAGQWPYRLQWKLSREGTVEGEFQLLPGRRESRPSWIKELGIDLRFHYRDKNSFRRRAIHAGIDRQVWELPAEVVRWWHGIKNYDRMPGTYGYRRHEEIPWPDYNVVGLVQSGEQDCRLWKAVDWDVGNLTHWRGAKSRGWLHLEDRLWGLGYGIAGLAQEAPGSLTADLDSGDLSAAISIRFQPRQARRLDPRGAGGESLLKSQKFFLVPNAGRWNDKMASDLDRLGLPSGDITTVEPDPDKVKFTPPKNLPKTTRAGQGVLFRIDEPAGVDRTAWPVTAGVPLRRGEIGSVEELSFTDSKGRPLPHQAEALAYWPDGSLKWVLLDTQADLPAGVGGVYSLKKGRAAAPLPKTTVTATETASGIRVDTGVLAFEIDRDGSGFIDRAWFDIDGNGSYSGQEMVVAPGDDRRNLLDFVRTDLHRTGDHDTGGSIDKSTVRITELKIERSGPLRAVVLIRGLHLNRAPSPFTLRLEVFAGKGWIRAQHTFVYTMNPRGEFVKAVGLKLPLRLDRGRITVPGENTPIAFDQSLAVGGLLQESPDRSLVWGAEKVTSPAEILSEGGRSSGWADVSDGDWGLTVAVRNFWQEFAKGITVDGDAGTVSAWFHPPEAAPLDLRRYSRWMYPQVGETTAPWPGRGEWRNVGYATGLAKTGTAVFAFHRGQVNPEEAEGIAKGFQDRPLAVCNPEYYGEVGVAGPFAGYDGKRFPELERTLTDICDWHIFARQRFSWYGLVDYGDVGHMCMPAIQYDDDAPYIFRDGWAYDIGRWGWTNTEGQDALGYFMSFLHTGYRPYLDAGSATARHNQDIDIFHWGPYKYQGHTRHNVSHWGDGDFEVRISQPSPNRFHYYLTGDPRSRDIIESVVDSLYVDYTIGHTADLGAILYGFLVRWEMTGDHLWRDRALGVCHAFDAYVQPDGGLQHGGLRIEAATGQRLREPDPKQANYSACFLHDFGGMHAMVELQQLTGDKKLWDMLYRHAGYCAEKGPANSSHRSYNWLLLAHVLDKTGEKRFADRILANLSEGELDRGIYSRDRSRWTGVHGQAANLRLNGEEKYQMGDGRGTATGVHDIYTVHSGFSWSQMPAVYRAMKLKGLMEKQIPKKEIPSVR